MERQEYRAISPRAHRLLSREEGYDVDFKRSVSGLHSEDLVAFANSPDGGAILIGVDEDETKNGLQRGKVVGCPVGDAEKLSILNRAESCIPRLEIDVVVENVDDVPFFRVEIPSGNHKPYCTSGGVYKIRGDGLNKPLTPTRLLAIFMENEQQVFIERFRNATKDLEETLNRILEQSFDLPRDASDTKGAARATVATLDRRVTELETVTIGKLERKIDRLLTFLEITSESD
jgi:predicted HTH transcriptional regulator